MFPNLAFKFYLISTLLFITVASLSGCRQAPPIPQKGDVVIWRQSSELIIKAKLGQRREHVITHPDTDHLFYEPEHERFIGQFPIDYQPVPFPKLTKEEHEAFETRWRTQKLPPRKSIHFIQFNLMLNGAKDKATDLRLSSGSRKMDDPNQVKVILGGYGTFPITTKSGVKRSPYNTRESFELDLMDKLDRNSKETKYGLDCYFIKDGRGDQRCFGKSTNPEISGFKFYVSPVFKNNIRVISHEFIYGGIKVEWFTDQKNINRAREIDAAIWRLLEAWNISHVQQNNQS